MTTPDHDESKPRRRWPTYLAIVLVLVLVVYPLSIGPAEVLITRWPNPTFIRCAQAIYYPLLPFLRIPHTEELVTSYVRFWMNITGTG
jgi:hypothetical protein